MGQETETITATHHIIAFPYSPPLFPGRFSHVPRTHMPPLREPFSPAPQVLQDRDGAVAVLHRRIRKADAPMQSNAAHRLRLYQVLLYSLAAPP